MPSRRRRTSELQKLWGGMEGAEGEYSAALATSPQIDAEKRAKETAALPRGAHEAAAKELLGVELAKGGGFVKGARGDHRRGIHDGVRGDIADRQAGCVGARWDPHHLVDVVEPTDRFACRPRNGSLEEGRDPPMERAPPPRRLFVGGPGLYLAALVRGLFHPSPSRRSASVWRPRPRVGDWSSSASGSPRVARHIGAPRRRNPRG